jgi:hypothetical protein
VRIDERYKQSSVIAFGGEAFSDMKAHEIPSGFHIEANGNDGGGAGWAIMNPHKQSSDLGLIGFGLTVYAGASGRVGGGGGNVAATIWVKDATKRRSR